MIVQEQFVGLFIFKSLVDLTLDMSVDLGHIYYVSIRWITLEISVDIVPSNLYLFWHMLVCSSVRVRWLTLEMSVDLTLEMSVDLRHIYNIRVRWRTLEISVDLELSNLCLFLTYFGLFIFKGEVTDFRDVSRPGPRDVSRPMIYLLCKGRVNDSRNISRPSAFNTLSFFDICLIIFL